MWLLHNGLELLAEKASYQGQKGDFAKVTHFCWTNSEVKNMLCSLICPACRFFKKVQCVIVELKKNMLTFSLSLKKVGQTGPNRVL